MELNYRDSMSTVKPQEIEVTPYVVFLRKDISEVSDTREDGTDYTYWQYKEAKMKPEEFKDYTDLIARKNALNGTEDSENIVSLIGGQEMNDINQLTIMEAIADLYVMLAELQTGGNA